MPSPKLTAIDLKAVSSIKTLLLQLHRLDNQLEDSPLSQLGAFNSAYGLVTHAINASLQDGYFENPKFIEKFTVCFSHYYFQVINDALAGKQDIAVAWSNLLQPSKDKGVPNFIYLLMGANAHINHDLSLVMKEMLYNGDTDNLLKDIIKVDKLLMQNSNDIVNSFSELETIPRIIKDRFKYFYLKPIMYMILYWRFKAWRGYKNIQAHGLRQERYRLRGKHTSKRLLTLGRLLYI